MKLLLSLCRVKWCKFLLATTIGFVATSPIFAQISPPSPSDLAAPKLDEAALKEMLAPIALYPDALIALILPASTVPGDIAMGARFVRANGDPNLIPSQPWDDSVKSLAHYPDVLKWMDDNLEWTTSVGDVFINQPADVMNAIQSLRAQAKAAGHLVDTPQQKVLQEESVIRILPAESEIIYVPYYDTESVYTQRYSPDLGSLITFALGSAIGSWLNYDVDWNRRNIYSGNWNPDWNRYNYNGWRNEPDPYVVFIDRNNARQWQANPNNFRRQTVQVRNNRLTRLAAIASDINENGVAVNTRQSARANRLLRPTQAKFARRDNAAEREAIRKAKKRQADAEIFNATESTPPSPNTARLPNQDAQKRREAKRQAHEEKRSPAASMPETEPPAPKTVPQTSDTSKAASKQKREARNPAKAPKTTTAPNATKEVQNAPVPKKEDQDSRDQRRQNRATKKQQTKPDVSQSVIPEPKRSKQEAASSKIERSKHNEQTTAPKVNKPQSSDRPQKRQQSSAVSESRNTSQKQQANQKEKSTQAKTQQSDSKQKKNK